MFGPSINYSESNVTFAKAHVTVDILGYRPSLSPHMYLPTASDNNDQYQHLPVMPGPPAMRFHSFALASSQLYISCALAKDFPSS